MTPGSPAARAGAKQGDVVLAFNGGEVGLAPTRGMLSLDLQWSY